MALTAASIATATAGARNARSFVLPHWWLTEALCIHRHESVNWHATRNWLGYPSRDHGGMQIDVSTWAADAPRSFPREPAAATPREQLIVSYRIWHANGNRFGGSAWPNSSVACGVA